MAFNAFREALLATGNERFPCCRDAVKFIDQSPLTWLQIRVSGTDISWVLYGQADMMTFASFHR